VGVGPGDPELLTLQAVRIIREAEVIALPKTGEQDIAALAIVKQVVDISGKELIELCLPMTKDETVLAACRQKAAAMLAEILKTGKSIVFLTLGDPAIYSTYLYLHEWLLSEGYDARLVPGVPSFCAVAAKLNMALCKGSEPLHLIPASYQNDREYLGWEGTRFDEIRKSLDKVIATLREEDHLALRRWWSAAPWKRADCNRPDVACIRGEQSELLFYHYRQRQGERGMIYFVGAGPGAADLLTIRGKALLEKADVIIYAGSLVNPELLKFAKQDCRILDSAGMTLEQVIEAMVGPARENKTVVRLHTGDPSIYGAIREQMDRLDSYNLGYEVVPGVSSFCAAAAALRAEYTLPEVSQSVIITRMEGRTPVPPKEEISLMAAHQASMVIFLSSGLLDKLTQRLLEGGYQADTPAAIVYKASWDDQKVLRCSVATLAETAALNGISKTALILIGNFLEGEYVRSKLYDPSFTHMYREASE
jgi:precorrin-4/cobalt-precorrin-4 C11-methyltransferase